MLGLISTGGGRRVCTLATASIDASIAAPAASLIVPAAGQEQQDQTRDDACATHSPSVPQFGSIH